MKCPFELPVTKIYSQILCCFGISDKVRNVIVDSVSEDEADYIVHAINSHKKLEKACDHAYGFMICVTNLDNEENLEWQENVTEELKQALKEAEKPK